jgi:hypothetical protein
MPNSKNIISFLFLTTLLLTVAGVGAQTSERWVNPDPYGLLFNQYDPNFYTGFAPREQDRDRITIFLGRGNQVRLRLVLSEDAINNYLPDQVARHTIYKEVIDKNIITLTTNKSWELYDQRITNEDVADMAARRSELSPEQWRELNLQAIEKLSPGRLHHIQREFPAMLDQFYTSLKTAEPVTDKNGKAKKLSKKQTLKALQTRLRLVNNFFPHRIYATELSDEQQAALDDLIALAQADQRTSFDPKATAFFTDITGGLYPVTDGKLDFYEYSSVFPAGTYDAMNTFEGHKIPRFSTTGVWPLIPREKGIGDVGMVDYISKAGYYGMIPMLPYQYAGGSSYNAFHNPGISNWMGGHKLIPKAWKESTDNSRSGKPYLRSSITSRGPVSHGCTRMSPGHLSEFREMLPSTSDGMQGIRAFLNLSQCYDIYDIDGDGSEEAMGVQYYIAFKGKSRVADKIWAQNERKDFYDWLYGDEIVYGEPGEVIVKKPYECEFVGRKAKLGPRHQNVKLYEAPYEPEYLQFYTINGVKATTSAGYDFNRELRRVGYGYQVDRKILRLE